ncbi:hypothetical protein WJX84_006142 [Apatococcus fuscideae]|uniref:Uncharacterized protein n=1 Tax=Apatococcus fuscideae TaxID=2026836 RepID=A0AAW1T2Q0_9CHLO
MKISVEQACPLIHLETRAEQTGTVHEMASNRSLRQGTNVWNMHLPPAVPELLPPPQEDHLHLAFIARPANDPPVPHCSTALPGQNHAQLFAVDMCSGIINPGPRFTQVPSEARVEHVHLGSDHHPAAALVVLKPSVYLVVNLPSMTTGGELRPPASAGIAGDWRACWVA